MSCEMCLFGNKSFQDTEITISFHKSFTKLVTCIFNATIHSFALKNKSTKEGDIAWYQV